MRPSGTVYQSSKSSSNGEIRIALTEKEKKHYRFMRIIGANLSSFALAFFVFAYGPSFELDLNYQAGLAKVQNVEASQPEEVKTPNTKVDEFSLSIPAIGASAQVVEDINPFSEKEYLDALKLGVAHAKGTGKPGEGKRIYLFAHSTNSPTYFSEYNAVFYQLRLLSEGDKIFVRYNGDTLVYNVTKKVVVSSSDTHWLTETINEEELVLQTCDPPGTSLRRLLIVAKPV